MADETPETPAAAAPEETADATPAPKVEKAVATEPRPVAAPADGEERELVHDGPNVLVEKVGGNFVWTDKTGNASTEPPA
jgi:hypothetical protein